MYETTTPEEIQDVEAAACGVPSPAVELHLVVGVGGGVVGAADDGCNAWHVEGGQHRRHRPVLGVSVAELPVLAPAPRAHHLAR